MEECYTKNISRAITYSEIRQLAEMLSNEIVEDFDALHRVHALKLIKSLREQGLKDVSYGRAAKIIAIYLKTSVILRNGAPTENIKVIHPPIDKILLDKLSAIPGLKGINVNVWTKLNKEGYWKLVEKLGEHFRYFDWRLEEYWIPEREVQEKGK
ncbi:hypothetical protein ACFP1I_04030 [Dyadobacter subterraneus]|uniref:Uncharacterized protein n=1 Tax=Dyadobacter subterraneus TaxID=2773304 RepID=A0ABR9WII9_9BACT|nr:hypothetical protein [Dyadobacter subterraneus]MBE9464701.1 hypothetical protein [Dyadobacter subterraneus]